MKKEFLTGNEAVVKGALAAGAKAMTGYPITPSTEIIQAWAQAQAENPELKFLQTEDEMSAGFAMIGACLAGLKSFTATAGPGNVLMQDAFSMAENMRLPTVAFINQRGGPSTGTVIYSQQELNLTCFGGNGDGLRVVYSASSVQEMYDLAIKAFDSAWRYRFPTFVLSDGYSAKTNVEIETYEPSEKNISLAQSEPYLLSGKEQFVNMRNCYNLEKELNQSINEAKKAFDLASEKLVEYEEYETHDAYVVIFAHGIVGAAAKVAAKELRKQNKKVGVFRPITLNPFPTNGALNSIKSAKKILVAESSLGQFKTLVKDKIFGSDIKVEELLKPAEGIGVDDLIKKAEEIYGNE